MAKTSYYKYANRQAESAVNWTEVANDMNNMLSATAAMRQARKDQIDEASREFGETLSNAPQGEAVNINQYALDHADNAQQYMLMQDQLLKSGKIKLRDYNLGRTNLEQGTKGLFETMKEAQEQYKIKMERAKASGMVVKDADGNDMVGSQKLETWLMEEVEAFGNFNNTSAFINPTNGMVSIMKRKSASGDAQGRTVTGQAIGDVPDVRTMAPAGQTPADYLSVQQLRQNVTQKFDKYDLSAGLNEQVEMLAETYVTASMTPGNKYYGMFETIDDVKQNPDFLAAQDKIITEIKANEYNAASILTNTATVNANGVGYTYTRNPELQGQEVFPVANLSQAQKTELTNAGIDVSGVNVKYDDVYYNLITNSLSSAQESQKEEAILLVDNPSQMSAGMPVPVFTDDQNTVIDKTVRNRMNVMIDRDIDATRIQKRTEFSPQAYKPTEGERLQKKEDDRNMGYIRDVEQMQTKPDGEFKTIVKERIANTNELLKSQGESRLIRNVKRDKEKFTILYQDPNNPADTKTITVDRYEKVNGEYDFNKPVDRKQVDRQLASLLTPIKDSFSSIYDNYLKTEGVETGDDGQPLPLDQSAGQAGDGIQTFSSPVISQDTHPRTAKFMETEIKDAYKGDSNEYGNYIRNSLSDAFRKLGMSIGNGNANTNTFQVTSTPFDFYDGEYIQVKINGKVYNPSFGGNPAGELYQDDYDQLPGLVQQYIDETYELYNKDLQAGELDD